MQLTDHDKQATENREPANEMNKEDPTQGILLSLHPITVNLEDLEVHVLTHFLWKRELRLTLQKWRHKHGSITLMVTNAKTQEIFSAI